LFSCPYLTRFTPPDRAGGPESRRITIQRAARLPVRLRQVLLVSLIERPCNPHWLPQKHPSRGWPKPTDLLSCAGRMSRGPERCRGAEPDVVFLWLAIRFVVRDVRMLEEAISMRLPGFGYARRTPRIQKSGLLARRGPAEPASEGITPDRTREKPASTSPAIFATAPPRTNLLRIIPLPRPGSGACLFQTFVRSIIFSFSSLSRSGGSNQP
jgi:hypothetical protein